MGAEPRRLEWRNSSQALAEAFGSLQASRTPLLTSSKILKRDPLLTSPSLWHSHASSTEEPKISPPSPASLCSKKAPGTEAHTTPSPSSSHFVARSRNLTESLRTALTPAFLSSFARPTITLSFGIVRSYPLYSNPPAGSFRRPTDFWRPRWDRFLSPSLDFVLFPLVCTPDSVFLS
ncbi:hypothetical protein M5K25_023388 [Dendrobium thyrsiflorum]|uniref:Uncharacterized protein n=1 Tax=Dendrobium thyrsiflorum TaxID=117978 RepID=A0ABD0UET9_DENTH